MTKIKADLTETESKAQKAAYMKQYRKRIKENAEQEQQLREGKDRVELQHLRQLRSIHHSLTKEELERLEALEQLYDPTYFEYTDDKDFYRDLSRKDRLALMYLGVNPPPINKELSDYAKSRVDSGISKLSFGVGGKQVDIDNNPIVKEEKSEKKPWGKITYKEVTN